MRISVWNHRAESVDVKFDSLNVASEEPDGHYCTKYVVRSVNIP